MAQGLGVGQKHSDQRLKGCLTLEAEGRVAREELCQRRPSSRALPDPSVGLGQQAWSVGERPPSLSFHRDWVTLGLCRDSRCHAARQTSLKQPPHLFPLGLDSASEPSSERRLGRCHQRI